MTENFCIITPGKELRRFVGSHIRRLFDFFGQKNKMSFFARNVGDETSVDYVPFDNESENFRCQRPSRPVEDNLKDDIIYNNIEDNFGINEKLEQERQRVSVKALNKKEICCSGFFR